MKKNYAIVVFLFIAAFFALASCKKNNANKPLIQLTVVDSSKTLTVTQGQAIKITLNNPGMADIVLIAGNTIVPF